MAILEEDRAVFDGNHLPKFSGVNSICSSVLPSAFKELSNFTMGQLETCLASPPVQQLFREVREVTLFAVSGIFTTNQRRGVHGVRWKSGSSVRISLEARLKFQESGVWFWEAAVVCSAFLNTHMKDGFALLASS